MEPKRRGWNTGKRSIFFEYFYKAIYRDLSWKSWDLFIIRIPQCTYASVNTQATFHNGFEIPKSLQPNLPWIMYGGGKLYKFSFFMCVPKIHVHYHRICHNTTIQWKYHSTMIRDPLVSCGNLVTGPPFQLNNRLLSFYWTKKIYLMLKYLYTLKSRSK